MKKHQCDQFIQQTALYYESIIAKMPGHVYWLDAQGLALGCNENVLNMFGFKSITEFKGLSFEEMGQICNWSLETVQSFKNDSFEVLNTGQAKLNIEEPPIANHEGKWIYFLTSRVPILDSNDNVIGVIGISIDITERKKLEKNLMIAKVKAEAANKAKTEFIMNMSHDLRTPLSGVIGLSYIQSKEGTNFQDRQYGQWTHDAGNQLLELLNSVLEVSAAEHYINNFAQNTIHLPHLIEELKLLMKPALIAKSLDLQIKIENPLPLITTDQIKLKRIILNILSNAVKFTKIGKVSLEINLLTITKNQVSIEILISDTGIGIPRDKLDKIFDRFYRVHPSFEAQYTGYGIGLFLVKKAVEQLGGKIKVSSEEGKGSCFSLTFIFPLAKDTSLPITINTWEPQSASGNHYSSEINKHLVLVAEDNTLVMHIVENLLVSLGYEVTTVTDGKAALNALQTQNFDWTLLDIGLPGLTGIEVVKIYRKWEKENNKSRRPIFALTAHEVDEIKEECEQAGFDYILNKPLTEDSISTINQWLDKKL